MSDNYSDNLNEEFDLNDIIYQVKDLKTRVKEAKENAAEPDDILYANIQRANDLLDLIERNASSSFSARLMEVAANLINTITQASNSIVNNDFQKETVDQKWKTLELKELEQQNKNSSNKSQDQLEDKGTQYQQNNYIMTDRESLLEFIEKNQLPDK